MAKTKGLEKKTKKSSLTKNSEKVVADEPSLDVKISELFSKSTAIELPKIADNVLALIPATEDSKCDSNSKTNSSDSGGNIEKPKKASKSKDPKKKETRTNNDYSEDDFSDNDSSSSCSEDEKDPSDKAKSAGKHWSPEEVKERNERTLFVGNVSVKSVEKQIFKKLKEIFSKFGKIETIRFRSIAFEKPLNRKTAFKLGIFRKERDSLNAYIVYQSKDCIEKAVQDLNGSLFLEHHIRVDCAASQGNYDMKKSVFIGNLAFDINEEVIWRLFEPCGAVRNVRIVRDSKTNLGKGFGYVEFKDRDSVGMALTLHESKIGERSIRVFKCRDGSSIAAKSNSQKTMHGNKRSKTSGKSFQGETSRPLMKKGANARMVKSKFSVGNGKKNNKPGPPALASSSDGKKERLKSFKQKSKLKGKKKPLFSQKSQQV